ncbi:hypothetical protein [Undibacterium sp. TJN19]|uniref:hypothetical protein n=1 Tax=Undibacterium sp. TJN19 TaxID=3413055 RepID=UPI003BF0DE05
MKSFIGSLFLASFFAINMAAASESITPEKIDLRVPVLKPSEVIAVARNYLTKEKHVNMSKYELVHVSFGYYSQWDNKMDVVNGTWSISYAPVGLRGPDSEINLSISNEKILSSSIFRILVPINFMCNLARRAQCIAPF